MIKGVTNDFAMKLEMELLDILIRAQHDSVTSESETVATNLSIVLMKDIEKILNLNNN